jgi:gamma-glutamyltranspeptidase
VNLRMTLFITAASIVFGITPGAAQIVERPPVSERHAVVTSDEPLASMAGMRMLHEGGNAFDATVATAIAVGVLDPRMSSIGGNGFATIYVAKSHEGWLPFAVWPSGSAPPPIRYLNSSADESTAFEPEQGPPGWHLRM